MTIYHLITISRPNSWYMRFKSFLSPFSLITPNQTTPHFFHTWTTHSYTANTPPPSFHPNQCYHSVSSTLKDTPYNMAYVNEQFRWPHQTRTYINIYSTCHILIRVCLWVSTVYMRNNEQVSYIRLKSNDPSHSTFQRCLRLKHQTRMKMRRWGCSDQFKDRVTRWDESQVCNQPCLEREHFKTMRWKTLCVYSELSAKCKSNKYITTEYMGICLWMNTTYFLCVWSYRVYLWGSPLHVSPI